MTLTEKTLDDILTYMEKSMANLARDACENLEVEGGMDGIQIFLEGQFDTRLENMLVAKSSGIHHLESGMKNKVIQKKQKILDAISDGMQD